MFSIHKKRLVLLLLIIFSILILSNNVLTDGICTGDVDCSRDDHCMGGSCMSRYCIVNDDCRNDENCVQNKCVSSSSTSELRTSTFPQAHSSYCRSNSNCWEGSICLDGTCVTHCNNDASCGSLQKCVNGECWNLPNYIRVLPGFGLNTPCNNDVDCLGGKCDGGVCVEALPSNVQDIVRICNNDVDCLGGKCDGGVCVISGRCPSRCGCASNSDCGYYISIPETSIRDYIDSCWYDAGLPCASGSTCVSDPTTGEGSCVSGSIADGVIQPLQVQPIVLDTNACPTDSNGNTCGCSSQNCVGTYFPWWSFGLVKTCSDSADDVVPCAEGYECRLDIGGESSCVSCRFSGEICVNNADCCGGNTCTKSADQFVGICQSSFITSILQDPCLYIQCSTGQTCDSSTGSCIGTITQEVCNPGELSSCNTLIEQVDLIKSTRSCTSSSNCFSNEKCDKSICKPLTCTSDLSCPQVTLQTPYKCLSGLCKKTCSVSSNCKTGETCKSGYCVAGPSISELQSCQNLITTCASGGGGDGQPVANGSTCNTNEQCISGNCENGVCGPLPSVPPFVWYKLDGNADESVTNDAEYNAGAAGTFREGIQWSSDSIDGQSLKMRSTTSPLKLPEKLKVGHLSQFTIMAWVKLNSADGIMSGTIRYYPIISEYNLGVAGKYFLAVKNDEIIFHPGVSQNLVAGGNFRAWTHVAVVVDTTRSTDQFIMYVHGQRVAASGTNNYLQTASSADTRYDLLIGDLAENGRLDKTKFGGVIDNVKIFRSVLTQSQVLEQIDCVNNNQCSTGNTCVVAEKHCAKICDYDYQCDFSNKEICSQGHCRTGCMSDRWCELWGGPGLTICDPIRGSYWCTTPCTSTSGCLIGQACKPDGHCTTACTIDGDCDVPNGEICGHMVNGVGYCEQGCTSDVQCAPNVCDPVRQGGHCALKCDNSNLFGVSNPKGCPVGTTCNLATGHCSCTDAACMGAIGRTCDESTNQCVQCTDNTQCPNGYCDIPNGYCVRGTTPPTGCVPPCGSGERCENNRCVTPTPPTICANVQCAAGESCDLESEVCISNDKQCSGGKCDVPYFCNNKNQCERCDNSKDSDGDKTYDCDDECPLDPSKKDNCDYSNRLGKTCAQLKGVLCGGGSCKSPSLVSTHTWEYPCCVTTDGSIPVCTKTEANALLGALTTERSACDDPDGDGEGTVTVVLTGEKSEAEIAEALGLEAATYTEPCTTNPMSGGQPVSFYTYGSLLLTLVLIGLYYFTHKKKHKKK